jgi:regulator of protease activity HflC (stomatin/prohibitin superfamily)
MTTPDVSSVNRSQEVEYPVHLPGLLMVFVNVLLIPLLGLGLFMMRGLVLVEPNQSRVVMLFGRYKGTIRKPGFHWINPFTNRHDVTLRVRNFQSERLKVNDLRGNPVEIAAVVVWRVHDTAQATFDVQNYESYVAVQTESSLSVMLAIRSGKLYSTLRPQRSSAQRRILSQAQAASSAVA